MRAANANAAPGEGGAAGIQFGKVGPRLNNQTQTQPQAAATILARLNRDDRCAARGVVAAGSSPVLALCRKLVAAGVDPGTRLHVFRAGTLCLRVRSIGE